MLLYSLYLCFKTRKISSEYHEATWITASVLSIMQILVLAIPILIISGSNNDAFYFVRAAAVFLISSTVTLLIFVPKAYRVHFKKEQQRITRFGSAVGSQSRRGSENGSLCESYVAGTESRRGSETGSATGGLNPALPVSKISSIISEPSNGAEPEGSAEGGKMDVDKHGDRDRRMSTESA